jgi:hypothetical protein
LDISLRRRREEEDVYMPDTKPEAEPTDGKFPMPADGQTSPKVRSDGVSDVTTHGRGGGGESGGGSYHNPHTGKEAEGKSGEPGGGQSSYDGEEPLDGDEVPPPKVSFPIDKGEGASG